MICAEGDDPESSVLSESEDEEVDIRAEDVGPLILLKSEEEEGDILRGPKNG